MRRTRPDAATRREQLESALARMTKILATHAGVERVVVFGSFARGEVGPRSDLDLLIVQRTEKRFMDRLDEMYRLLVPDVACDILVYTPEEVERLPASNAFVARALREGKVIHAA